MPITSGDPNGIDDFKDMPLVKEDEFKIIDDEPMIKDTRRSDDRNINVTVNVGGRGEPDIPKRPMMAVPESDLKDIPEREKDLYPHTKSGLKREIKAEKARREAILLAGAKKKPYELKLREEMAKTEQARAEQEERIASGKKAKFCERHPTICKTAKNTATAAKIVTAPVWGPGYAAGYVAGKAKPKKDADTDHGPEPKPKTVRRTTSKTKTTVKRSPAKKKTASKTASTPKKKTKTKTTVKRTSDKMTRNTPRTARKGKTGTKTRRTTPKSKKTRKSRNDGSWWEQGGAGF